MKDREQAIQICIAGLNDELVGKPDKLILQNRLEKLVRSDKALLDAKTFKRICLVEPEKVFYC